MKKIVVIDGQGGGIGARIIAELKGALPSDTEIIAAGTNAFASNAMLKAGADCAASGENAVIFNAQNADIILGPIGIITANAIMGEISPQMAGAVSSSGALKILVPSQKCSVRIAGVEPKPLDAYIRLAAAEALREIGS